MHDSNVSFFFERLDVYRLTLDIADDMASQTERFPQHGRALSDQLNRASISIAANIAEGNGRSSQADRRKFFIIARGSLAECIPLLELANRRRLFPDAAHHDLRARLHEASRMLSGLIKNPGGLPPAKRR